MLQLNQKNWGTCKEKCQSRIDTVIKPYSCLFGNRIPADRYYWTLSGQCFNESGYVNGCEHDQILKSNLVKPEQFIGVELNPDIHSMNCKIPGSIWKSGDMNDLLRKECKKFKPAIVRYDDTKMPKGCKTNFADTIFTLNYSGLRDIMVIFTTTLQYRSHKSTEKNIIDEVCNNARFKYCMTQGWKIVDGVYIYMNGAVKMGSIIVYR